MFYYLSSAARPLSIAHFVLLVETLAKGLITLALLEADAIFVQQALDPACGLEVDAHRQDYCSPFHLPSSLSFVCFSLLISVFTVLQRPPIRWCTSSQKNYREKDEG